MIKVYFHGRPAGQDFWPAENQIINSDLIYLKSFLDYKVGSKESSVMIIDQINGNSYYTYLHRKNFFEKGGRSDSYCAITICFEKKICKNTITLYNLLDQAYNFLSKNNILSKTSNEEKFLVNSYSEKSDVFIKCAEVIKTNLDKLEASENITNIDTRSTSGSIYSLKEVDSELFREDARKTKIIISADYQPRFTNLEIQNAELKQQLNQVGLKHTKDLEEKEKAHKEEIAKYNNLLTKKDVAISDLNNKLRATEAKLHDLEKQIGNAPILKKWNELKPEIEKFVGLWTQKFQIKQGVKPPKSAMLSISKIVTYTNTLLLVVILILSLNKCEAPGSPLVDIPENESNNTELVVENQTMQSQQTETPETEEYNSTENLDNESVNTYTINIGGYDGKGNLKPQKEYTLDLKKVQISCEFSLETAPSGTKIIGNKLITGSEGGKIVICGNGDGFNVKPRTLVIDEDNQ